MRTFVIGDIHGGDPLTAPVFVDRVINIDTGAGTNGRLTIMDVETKKYWQSDLVNTFYGGYKPR